MSSSQMLPYKNKHHALMLIKHVKLLKSCQQGPTSANDAGHAAKTRADTF